MRALKHLSILAAVVAVAALLTPPASADLRVEIDYQNLSLSYDTLGNLTVDHRTNSIASGELKTNGTTLDTADIFNILGPSFGLSFAATVTDGPGLNDIGINGLFKATDAVTTLAAPSIMADFANANLTGDLDGVSFGNGVLRIEGRILTSGANSSILVNPTPGDWVYHGGPVGNPPGLDGIADQFTIGSLARDAYDTGILAVLEVNLIRYGDGTLIGAVDADTLFATALAHNGFASDSAQVQLTVVPVPGAALLGIFGLGVIARIRRRLA